MAEWDQQEGEPSLWFERFERFRVMGPERTLLGCVRKWEAANGKKKQSDVIPGSWSAAASRWRWRARATAWDAEQNRLNRQAEANSLDARRKAWIAQAQAVQNKAVERLLTLKADTLNYRDVLAGVTDGVKLELLARGEPGEIHRNEVVAVNWDDLCRPREEAIDPIEMKIREASLPDTNGHTSSDD